MMEVVDGRFDCGVDLRIMISYRSLGWLQAATPEFKAYQEQVLSNSARFAKVVVFSFRPCYVIPDKKQCDQ